MGGAGPASWESEGGDSVTAVRVSEQLFGDTIRHRRMVPLPHAPSTPGGRNHADEVSMTPASARGVRRPGIKHGQHGHFT